MHQFQTTDVPHYPGALTVIRAMKVDRNGVLVSPQRPYVWKPGMNSASCPMDRVTTPGVYRFDPTTQNYVRGAGANILGHKVAARTCTCGFYAYFDQKHATTYLPNAPHEAAFVIVEASGRMTAGLHGIKAEKMKVVGIIPKYPPPPEIPPEPQLPPQPNLLTRWIFFLAALMWVPLSLVWLVPSLENNEPLNIVYWTIWSAWFALFIRSFVVTRRYKKASAKFSDDVDDWLQKVNELTKGTMSMKFCDVPDIVIERCKRLYPEAKIYATLEEALAAHPLSSYDEI